VNELYAFRCGDGSPIVCVHGIGVNSTYFRRLARELASRGRRVLVPDLPGWGRSPRPAGVLDVGELADALLVFMTSEGVERAPLVANSMGCQVAVEIAIRRPELVSHLVLIGPTVDPHLRPWPKMVPGFVLDCAREPPSLWWIIARDYAKMGPRRFVGTARCANAHRIERRLPLVRQPTLVLRGGRDGFVSQRWCEQAAALLPRGRLVVVPGEPHAVHYTAPHVVAQEVQQHLDER
jgi:pimeloyl-ACP methyl ester carboxylesterase